MTEPFRPRYSLTPRMQRQIKMIDSTRGFLDAVRLREEWNEEVKKARIADALSSINLEQDSEAGITIEQAFELSRNPPDRELAGAEREFLNYLTAFDLIDGLRGARDYRIQAGDLRNLHRRLVRGVRGGDRNTGVFRRETVKVGAQVGGETIVHHLPPPWSEVEPTVTSLLDWIDAVKHYPRPAQIAAGAEDPWVHPAIVSGIAQHRLVWIHPFVDGNGRTARMLTTLVLYTRGYDFKYLFDLSSYYNRDRTRYFRALRTADRADDYTEWLEYFLGGLSFQMGTIRSHAIRCAAGVSEELSQE